MLGSNPPNFLHLSPSVVSHNTDVCIASTANSRLTMKAKLYQLHTAGHNKCFYDTIIVFSHLISGERKKKIPYQKAEKFD